ncbi:MAG: Flp pilus assembly protein CpaB [Janthinobacterium lividum]
MLRLLLIALIFCGLAGFGTIGWVVLSNQGAVSAPLPPPKRLTVVTLTRPLQPGMLLKPEDLAGAEQDQAALAPGYVVDAADTLRGLVGSVVRRPLLPGDVLRLPGDVLRPADRGFVAAVLSPGTRAVTVAADMISGAAGLIWPGDRVDLVLTQTIEDAGLSPGQRVAAETVLRDVRVIAIDQQIDQANPAPPDPAATQAAAPGASPGTSPGTNPAATPAAIRDSHVVAKTVTLEVTPANGQLVEVAARLGRLTLALRSANAGPADAAPSAAVWASDVSAALSRQPAARQAPASLRVFPGGADAKEFKF